MIDKIKICAVFCHSLCEIKHAKVKGREQKNMKKEFTNSLFVK